MVGIKVRDDENINKALRRFKSVVKNSNVLNEYRENQYYTKPSKERREALKEAKKRSN